RSHPGEARWRALCARQSRSSPLPPPQNRGRRRPPRPPGKQGSPPSPCRCRFRLPPRGRHTPRPSRRRHRNFRYPNSSSAPYTWLWRMLYKGSLPINSRRFVARFFRTIFPNPLTEPWKEMRITKVEAILLRPMGPIDTAIGDGSQDGVLVRVHTDEGITGL